MAKEIKFEHKPLCWVITDNDASYVVVELGGQATLGKLSGRAYFYPNPNDNWEKLSVEFHKAKQGIHSLSGFRAKSCPGLVDSIESAAREWIAANPDALEAERVASQNRYIASEAAKVADLETLLEAERKRLTAAQGGEWWYDINKRERREYWEREEAKRAARMQP